MEIWLTVYVIGAVMMFLIIGGLGTVLATIAEASFRERLGLYTLATMLSLVWPLTLLVSLVGSAFKKM